VPDKSKVTTKGKDTKDRKVRGRSQSSNGITNAINSDPKRLCFSVTINLLDRLDSSSHAKRRIVRQRSTADNTAVPNLNTRVPVIKASEIVVGTFFPFLLSHSQGEELGKGQYGKVYKGKCRGENVAVKVLFKEQSTEWDKDAVAAFEKEVEIMSQIHHPNVGMSQA
jgi:hypothetical protein